MKPLVSILIPAYNAERWIADAIQSSLAQTWSPLEVVVIDDGSRDHTLVIAKQFESKHVRVISQPNGGAASARNRGLAACQGEWVQWLDADDLLAPDKVASQMEAFERSGNRRLLLSGGWGAFALRPTAAKFRPSALWQDLTPAEWLLRQLEQNLHMQTATWLVSRELTDAAGPWNERLATFDDGEYFCRVVLASDGVRFVPSARVFYRMVSTPRCSDVRGSQTKIDAYVLGLRLYFEHLTTHVGGERARTACVTYLQTALRDYYDEQSCLYAELQKLAGDYGGVLRRPRLSWKYVWLQVLFGWTAAREVQLRYNRFKTLIQKVSDNVLLWIAARTSL